MCHVGADGKTRRIDLVAIPAGRSCGVAEGFLVRSGLDRDDDGTLDPSEVDATARL